MQNSENDLDIWNLLNRSYVVKEKAIKDLSKYNKKWNLRRKANLLSLQRTNEKVKTLRQQRRELLHLSIKMTRYFKELNGLKGEIQSRIKELKVEIIVVKLFLNKFKDEQNLPKESVERKKKKKKLLALKVSEVNSYERILDNLERFTKHLDEKTFEHLKNEISIVREQIARINDNKYLLFPEANNRSKLIIHMYNLKKINEEHKRIRRVIRYEIITRDKNLVSLVKLFYNYKKKEPISLKLFNILDEKVYKKVKTHV